MKYLQKQTVLTTTHKIMIGANLVSDDFTLVVKPKVNNIIDNMHVAINKPIPMTGLCFNKNALIKYRMLVNGAALPDISLSLLADTLSLNKPQYIDITLNDKYWNTVANKEIKNTIFAAPVKFILAILNPELLINKLKPYAINVPKAIQCTTLRNNKATTFIVILSAEATFLTDAAGENIILKILALGSSII